MMNHEVRFGRSFKSTLICGTILESVQIGLEFEGPVDPQSGMIVNLMDVDQWILQRPSKQRSCRSEYFLNFKDYFQNCAEEKSIKLSSFWMRISTVKASWCQGWSKDRIEFEIQRSIYVPSQTSHSIQKKLQCHLSFVGPIFAKFPMPTAEEMKDIFQNQLQLSTRFQGKLKKARWIDPESEFPMTVIF